jgi:hypothetical protein
MVSNVLRPAAVFLVPALLLLLTACASAPAEQDLDWESWEGEFTGMVVADLKLKIARVTQTQDGDLVDGVFEGRIEKVSGGYGSGTMNGAITGRIKAGVLEARLNGVGHVTEGSDRFLGQMQGTFSGTQGSGTWHIQTRSSEGLPPFSGAWRVEKVASTP